MFEYKEAFSRNLGLVTKAEQEILQDSTIAIAGVGGVGGAHALILARMGVSNFHIADLDHFELANFNRQVGGDINSIGCHKAEVMRTKILEINPTAKVTLFKSGVTEDNMTEFLKGVDLYVDGLDFFVLDLRAKLFRKCRENNIFAMTAGPIGISTALLIFDPKKMSFDDYFQLDGKGEIEKAVYFLVGLSPKLLHRHHIVDFDYIDLQKQRGPSLAPACAACSAVIGTEALKILLKRGKVLSAPWHMQFDMYKNKYHKTYNFMGNRNPLKKLKIKVVQKMMLEKAEACQKRQAMHATP